MQQDASTTSLMDHLSDVDKRRRALVMRQKEVETRIALATQEEQKLRRQCEAMSQEEAQLKQQLDILVREQQQVHLCLLSEADRVRHGEEEEPLLRQHVTERLTQVANEAQEWQGRLRELEQLHQTWLSDEVVTSLKTAIRDAAKAVTAAKDAKGALENELLQGELELRQLGEAVARAQDAVAGGDALLDGLAAASADGEDAMSTVTGLSSAADDETGGGRHDAVAGKAQVLREELQQAEYAMTHAAEQHARQSAALRREVDDLASRATELTHWLSDVQASTRQLAATLDELQYCTTHQVCVGCHTRQRQQQQQPQQEQRERNTSDVCSS